MLGGGAGGKGTVENDLCFGRENGKDIAGPKLIFHPELSLQRKRDNIKKRWREVGEQTGLGFTVKKYIESLERRRFISRQDFTAEERFRENAYAKRGWFIFRQQSLRRRGTAQQINARELLPPVFTTVTRWQSNG